MMPTLRSKFDDLVWGETLERRGVAGRVIAVVMSYLYGLIRDLFSGELTLRAMSLV